jgi:hypothetical protein
MGRLVGYSISMHPLLCQCALPCPSPPMMCQGNLTRQYEGCLSFVLPMSYHVELICQITSYLGHAHRLPNSRLLGSLMCHMMMHLTARIELFQALLPYFLMMKQALYKQ